MWGRPSLVCVLAGLAALACALPADAESGPARWSLVARIFGEEQSVGVTRALRGSWEAFVTLQGDFERYESDGYSGLWDLDLDFAGVMGELGAWGTVVRLGKASVLIGPSFQVWSARTKGSWIWGDTRLPASGSISGWTADLGLRIGLEAPLYRGLSVLIADRPLAVYLRRSDLEDDMSWFAETSPYEETSREAAMDIHPTLGLRVRF